MSRLGAQDWAEAGLQALGEGGTSAVAVEPLAARLGVSKGSFYWHFGKRDDLLAAVIALWEERGTDQLIVEIEAGVATREERLRALFDRVFAEHPASAIERALLAAAEDPRVRAALERVTRRRVDYLTALMAEFGLSGRAARRRAVFAYSAFVGTLELSAATPDALHRAAGSPAGYAEEVLGLLTGTATSDPGPAT